MREYGISEQCFYYWRSKYGGMEVSEATLLRELEAENRKLKKLMVETKQDKFMLKDVYRKYC